MKKKYKDFIILLSVFMLFLFRNSINEIIIIISKDFDFSNASEYTYNEINTELNEIRKIIDLESNNYEYIKTRVKYRDVLEFTDNIQIFKGSKDGIKEDMPVINDKGLVGVVKHTDKSISIVELITNKNSKISVKVNDTYGILKYQNNELIISDITNYDKLSIGDEIFTSGIGNLPGKIYIGKVKDINLNNLGIEQIVKVDPAVDFNNITYLIVVNNS